MTARWLVEVEQEVLRRIARAHEVFFFLDYDGTLSALAPTPDAAVPLPGTAALLAQLAAAPGVQVAVVSGRPIAEVRKFLVVPGIHYVGIHGVEVTLASGETRADSGTATVRAALPDIKRRLREAVGAAPGVAFEDKGAALACHYRLASRAAAAAVRRAVASVVREYRRRGVPIALVHGHEVVEMRPAHVNKGKTVCALLAAQGRSALPVYIGDDQTDEDAFRLLPAGSITLRVGPATTPTWACYRVERPDEVQHFLREALARRVARMPNSGGEQGAARHR